MQDRGKADPTPWVTSADLTPEQLGPDISRDPSGQYRAGGSRKRRGGAVGGVVAAVLAVLAKLQFLLILLKIPVLLSLVTILISFGAYALWLGPGFAAALISMILIHEMGHVLELRHQGIRASAPVFIPFFGAAIFQRQMARSPFDQAKVAIAGPVAGTAGAIAAYALFAATSNPLFLLTAYLGFFINLINLIPVWMLDGGWIANLISPALKVVGIAVLVTLMLFFGFDSPFLLLFAVLGAYELLGMWRHRATRIPLAQLATVEQRWSMGVVYISLIVLLALASFNVNGQLHSLCQLQTQCR